MDSSAPPEERLRDSNPPEQPSSLHYERRIVLLASLAAIPGIVAAAILLYFSHWNLMLRWGVFLAVCLATAVAVRIVRKQIVHPLHTLSNVIAALREEDFSFRARNAAAGDPLGQLALEINTLAELLAAQNTRTIEATALLRRVIEAVDAPMFAFDPTAELRLVNSAGERLLHKPAAALLGRTAGQLGLGRILSSNDEVEVALPQTPGRRWFVRRSQFRQNGVPHTLLVLSDVSRVLREEERSAWQRLIRVLGHELNNSLTPIKSIAGSLAARVSGIHLEAQDRQDFERGLCIIESRAASLNRFLQAYRRLTQMPPPAIADVDLSALVHRTAALETRVTITVYNGPSITVMLDPDQIEQMLINLIKNAAEAALEAHGTNKDQADVAIAWSAISDQLVLTITDNGAGLMNSDNAFVPFYTTKEEGTGIGLVLARQIAEAHHGGIRLANRDDGQGCVATVTLPLAARDELAEPSASGHTHPNPNRTAESEG